MVVTAVVAARAEGKGTVNRAVKGRAMRSGRRRHGTRAVDALSGKRVPRHWMFWCCVGVVE